MPERARRPTAADVARRSGVSTATVSYVLNRTPGQTIPEATRLRVLTACEELDYIPSAHAQALARGVSRVVLVDLSEFPHGILAADQARALGETLEQAGFVAVVAPPGWGSTDHTLLRGLAPLLVPFAVITVSPLPDAIARELTRLGVQRQIALAPPDRIDGWIGRSARTQVRHLREHGHTRIGYWLPADAHLSHFAQARLRAAQDEGARFGDVEVTALGAGDDAASIIAAVRAAGVTAVAAYNDETAFPVVAALHAADIRIPDGVAVMGIDDHPLAAYAIPPLTTVAFGTSELTAMASVASHLVDETPIPQTDPDDALPVVVERASV